MKKPTKRPEIRLVVDQVLPGWARCLSTADVRVVDGGRDVEPEPHVIAPLFFQRPPSVPVVDPTPQQQALDELRRRHRRPARPGARRAREG